jgi:arabinoxylan arabinofuranohydrolase
MISGCSGEAEMGPDDGDPIVRITFDLNYHGAPSVSSVKVGKGTAADNAWPADPERSSFFIFDGWYAGTEEYTNETVINNNVTVKAKWVFAPPASDLEDQPDKAALEALFSVQGGFPAVLSDSWKIWGHHNSLITHAFSADPTVIVYNDRVYFYTSNDTLLYNTSGAPIQITYSEGIQGIRVLSSADLANWTDHGVINITGPKSTDPLIPDTTPLIAPYTYASRSWAPAAAWKMIGGKPKFFVYYGDNGIGVITADSPTGPWTSPLNDYLIGRDTPNCADVSWLFDPGVLVDDDGRGYLFLGGGDPQDADDTGNARCVQLGDDMISLAILPRKWYVPFLFEDSEIAKINGKYYYSYCTNKGSPKGNSLQGDFQIAYMVSSEPLRSYSDPVGIMAAPAEQLGTPDENNHHCIFEFKGSAYMAYHASSLAQSMGLNFHYRSSHIDRISINSEGVISPITMTRKGVEQAGKFNPYILNEAETIGIQGGVYTRPDQEASNGMAVTSIDTGDWLALYGVDFGSAGAKKIIARVRTPDTPADYVGAIELRLDPSGDGVTADNGSLDGAANTARIKGGEVIGRVQIKAKAGKAGQYAYVVLDLDKTITGVHDLVFVFYSSLGVRPNTVTPGSRHKLGFEFDQWQFLE